MRATALGSAACSRAARAIRAGADEEARGVVREDVADPGYLGPASLEILIHESSHQWGSIIGCRERVVAAWTPHLDGNATIDEAIDKLVSEWP